MTVRIVLVPKDCFSLSYIFMNPFKEPLLLPWDAKQSAKI
jgi:hypothetical protein